MLTEQWVYEVIIESHYQLCMWQVFDVQTAF